MYPRTLHPCANERLLVYIWVRPPSFCTVMNLLLYSTFTERLASFIDSKLSLDVITQATTHSTVQMLLAATECGQDIRL